MALPTLKPAAGSYGETSTSRPVHEALPVVALQRCPLEVVAQDTRGAPSGVERTPHRRLIDAARAAGNQRPFGTGGKLTDSDRVVADFLVHMPRADDRQAAVFQNVPVAASVEDGGRMASQMCFQPLRVLIVGAAQHPDRPLLPPLDRPLQLAVSVAEAGNPVDEIEYTPAAEQQGARLCGEQSGRLQAVRAQEPVQILVLSRLQDIRRRFAPANDERGRQQENGLRIGREFAYHASVP